jgi:hypothetical protein
LLSFEPKDRPSAEEALADPYFKGLAKVDREPSCQPITKMEFEFERRRVTKEVIKELIFREILEYHPLLLKDYMNGVERTNFQYPSAVDQFRKQFAHLEENGSMSGPVTPLERKHVSLPRSTILHSNSIHLKERQDGSSFKDCQNGECVNRKNHGEAEGIPVTVSRTLQAHQRYISAKPGKVGPVAPYENGNIVKGSYDIRTMSRSTGLPSYNYRESSTTKLERERDFCMQVPECEMATKRAPDVSINIDSNPFFMTRAGVNKIEHVVGDGIAIDTNLLQAKAHFGSTTATAGHRKVGTVECGITRMY